MRQKYLIAVLLLVIAMPLAAVRADDATGTNTTTAPTDCGTRPVRPAAGATADQMTAFQTAMQTYFKCVHPNATTGAGWHNGQGNPTIKADKTQLTADRCTLVNQRITDRLNNFQSKQNGDSTIFGNVFGRLGNIQVRLANAGLKTDQLTTDLATLKTKIDKVNTDYASFISGLKDTENFTCGQSQGQFMGKLGAARGILTSVRTDRMAVRSYITGTIIPDIQALRKQLPAAKTNSTASNTSSN